MNRPADLSPVSPSPPARRLRLHAGAGILALVLAPLAVRGMLIENGLNVQTLSSNPNAVYSYSAAVGDGNRAEGVNSLAVGNGNHTVGGNSFTAGARNTVGGENALAVGVENVVNGYEGNFAAGMDNYVNGWSNGAIGNLNSISSDGNGGGKQSLAWGVGNQILAHVSNATVAGHYNIAGATHTHTIGTVLVNNSFGSTALGWYNKPFNNDNNEPAARSSWRAGDSLLVVGNGLGESQRSNALVVTKGGAVHVPTGPLTVGGYPVLTTGSGAITAGGGGITNGGLLAVGPNLAWGNASAAIGYQTWASGHASLATGDGTVSAGYETSTFGKGTKAFGFASFAGGWGAETGVPGNEILSNGDHPGAFSLSFGKETKARGTASVSLGYQSAALAHSSLASGYKSEAYGGGSVAMGWDSKAWKRGQTVLGRRNAIPATPSPLPVVDQTNAAFSEEDEVLVVGGGNDTVRKNALTVKANGDLKTPGKVEAAGAVFTQPVILTADAVAGDIPMFNAGN